MCPMQKQAASVQAKARCESVDTPQNDRPKLGRVAHREHEIYTARRYALATARFILNLHGIVYVPKRCSCGWWKLEKA